MNAVYEWLTSDGIGFGCGTELEFAYWNDQGVNPEGATLGNVLGHEPASKDEQRKALWGVA